MSHPVGRVAHDPYAPVVSYLQQNDRLIRENVSLRLQNIELRSALSEAYSTTEELQGSLVCTQDRAWVEQELLRSRLAEKETRIETLQRSNEEKNRVIQELTEKNQRLTMIQEVFAGQLSASQEEVIRLRLAAKAQFGQEEQSSRSPPSTAIGPIERETPSSRSSNAENRLPPSLAKGDPQEINARLRGKLGIPTGCYLIAKKDLPSVSLDSSSVEGRLLQIYWDRCFAEWTGKRKFKDTFISMLKNIATAMGNARGKPTNDSILRDWIHGKQSPVLMPLPLFEFFGSRPLFVKAAVDAGLNFHDLNQLEQNQIFFHLVCLALIYQLDFSPNYPFSKMEEDCRKYRPELIARLEYLRPSRGN